MSGPFGAGALQYFSGAKSFYTYELDQSLRFNDDDSAYLEKTFSTTGNRRTFTVSFWFKRCRDDTAEYLFAGGDDTSNRFHMDINASGTFQVEAKSGGSTQIKMEGGPTLRDLSAWYHFVLRVDTTQSTESDRVRLYVNGDLITFNSNTFPSQNADLNWNLNDQVRIGRAGWTTSYYDGYMCEFINVDGSSLAPTNFGETKENIWIPKDYTGSYGTNGFRLSFQDSAAFGDDTSGNDNDFTANNFASTDQMPDSPTNNRAVFNALLKDVKHTTTLSDGNKTISFTSGSEGFSGVPLTIFRDSGQAYCEVNLDRTYSANSTDSQTVFVLAPEVDISALGSGSLNSNLVGAYNGGGSSDAPAEISSNGVDQGGSPSKFRSTNDRIGVYIDFDAGKGFFALNGTVQTVNGTPDIANGTNPHFTFTANKRLTIGVGGIHAGTPAILTLKDHPSDWGTTPPDGYTAFATVDLPDPGIDPNNNENPTDYFNTVLYSGNKTARSITGVGFQPDWVWIKNRSRTNNHLLYDSVRGATKTLRTDNTDEESTNTGKLTSFDSDGFSLGTDNNPNRSGDTFVAWNWKAGGSASSNSDGSITSNVSVSTEAGFSIVSYTGTGSNATVGHGLGVAPAMYWVKARTEPTGGVHAGSDQGNWVVYHQSLDASAPEDKFLLLNETNAVGDTAVVWNDTAPTSSVFTISTSADVNESSDTYVAYCFSEIEGYSRFGKYTGTGNASNGPFLYMGFRPAFLLVKKVDAAENWFMIDIARQPTNDGNIPRLLPNLNNAEATDSSIAGDFVSNGFQVRATQNMINNDNSTYIYMAFADQPFKYANARL